MVVVAVAHRYGEARWQILGAPQKLWAPTPLEALVPLPKCTPDPDPSWHHFTVTYSRPWRRLWFKQHWARCLHCPLKIAVGGNQRRARDFVHGRP